MVVCIDVLAPAVMHYPHKSATVILVSDSQGSQGLRGLVYSQREAVIVGVPQKSKSSWQTLTYPVTEPGGWDLPILCVRLGDLGKRLI